LSAAHDKQMLDKALAIIDEVGDILTLKYSRIAVPNFSEEDEDFQSRYKHLPKYLVEGGH